MNRIYIFLLLALGLLAFSWAQQCKEGFIFNPKREKCEAAPATEAPVKCRRGRYWLPSKKRCVKLRKIISNFFPETHDNSTRKDSKHPCPKGTVPLGKQCVKESIRKKKPTQTKEKTMFLEPKGSKYQIFIKAKH
ncbi:hypothetical protein KR084_012392 [Drosophila pseudotakahashii]|nr:hypothetical protein KR084_012392 [Drosophila pseudotakahashii]